MITRLSTAVKTTTPARWRTLTPSTIGRTEVSAARIGDAVYVVGGFAEPDGLTSDIVERYDLKLDRWTRLRDAPTVRGAHVAGVIGTRMYVAGGAENSQPLDRLEIYDFATNRWSTGPPMRLAREHLAGAVQDGKLYAIAGRAAGKGNYAVVERYTPACRRWERVSKLGKPRGGIAAATVAGRIVVVGGGLSYSRSVTSLRIR